LPAAKPFELVALQKVPIALILFYAILASKAHRTF